MALAVLTLLLALVLFSNAFDVFHCDLEAEFVSAM